MTTTVVRLAAEVAAGKQLPASLTIKTNKRYGGGQVHPYAVTANSNTISNRPVRIRSVATSVIVAPISSMNQAEQEEDEDEEEEDQEEEQDQAEDEEERLAEATDQEEEQVAAANGLLAWSRAAASQHQHQQQQQQQQQAQAVLMQG
ncbi:hypothetical protein KR054_011058 [Drosophila jambulina]|nr:hypothetical protein KR054_011058 [Drosophila jambulina]